MKTFKQIFKKLSWIFAMLFLASGCQQLPGKLIGIRILTDQETFNPVLEPDVTGNITVQGIYSVGKYLELGDDEVAIHAVTKLASGDVDGRKTIRKGDYILVEDDNVFVEALWKAKEIIAYSREGYSDRQWVMPESWNGIKSVDLYAITMEGPEPLESGKKIENGMLELSLDQDQAVSIVPNGCKINTLKK